MQSVRRTWGLVAALVAVLAGSGVGVAPTPAAAQGARAAQATGLTVTVDPAEDLVDGTPVTVTVTGLDPDTWVNAAQCPADAAYLYDDCDTFDIAYGEADGAGSITLSLRVDALLTSGYEEPHETDCREHPCVIAISTDDADVAATASLHFLPDGPLAPPPVVTVTPDDQLTDLQTVTVNGSGLVWRTYGLLVQCAAGVGDAGDCDFETLADFETAEDGSFEFAFQVSTLIDTGSHGVVDCRQPGSCVLATTQDYSLSPERSAVAPLAFDPDAEPIVPTLTVTPDADLVDGQTVSVTGSGFRPDHWVGLLLCSSDPSYENCQYTDGFAEIGPDGTFTTELTAYALIATDAGDVDCRTSAEPCLLVAAGGSLTSPRAGRAPLHFAPDAPLLPPPTIEVEPSTGLPDAANVTVTGEGFTPHGSAFVDVCKAGGDDDFESCDPQAQVYATPDADGAFAVDLGVASSFETWDGGPIDCLAAPGCEVRAEDGARRRRATAPLTFAPPVDDDRRYLDPVFDEVDVTRDIVYRETVDAHGDPVQLTLDVYEPAGDTADMRPAVVWMHDGWFTDSEDGEGDMARYAEAFARRGYVAITVGYRTRPDLDCCPTDDALAITDAILDGHDDAAAALEWLHEHADEYRIDHEAVAVGGAAAGATNSFGLAYPPDDMGGHEPPPHHTEAVATAAAASDAMGPADHEPSNMVAAALPISGVSFGGGAAGGPPVLAFNGDDATTAPLHLAESTCTRAEQAGSHCEVVAYAGAGDEIATTRQRDIVRRSADFLADMVLGPLGYLDPAQEPPTTTPTTTPTTGSTAPTSPPTTAASPPAGGSLPRTGSDATMTLVRIGLALAGLGTVLTLVARRRRLLRLRTDGGHAGVRTAALLAIAVLAALVIPRAASGQEADDPPADGPTEDTVPTTTVPPDPGTTDPTVPGTTVPGEPTTTVPGEPATTVPGTGPDGTTTTTMDHEDPPPDAASDDPGHEDPEDPGPGDPGHEFPPEWTDEQVAFAETLIADTEVALERYRNQAILPLLGYVWIHDGTEPGTYQHWINTGWIVDENTLEPEHPESLVFRNTEDGPVLEAAMYMLGLGYNMANIPEDIAWLPGWHVHENLCFEGLRLVGIAVDGVCERGFILIPPPMVHVWIVDTPCGRFPGVDEHGLMCDHEEH